MSDDEAGPKLPVCYLRVGDHVRWLCSASDGRDVRATTRYRSGTRMRVRGQPCASVRISGLEIPVGDEPIPTNIQGG